MEDKINALHEGILRCSRESERAVGIRRDSSGIWYLVEFKNPGYLDCEALEAARQVGLFCRKFVIAWCESGPHTRQVLWAPQWVKKDDLGYGHERELLMRVSGRVEALNLLLEHTRLQHWTWKVEESVLTDASNVKAFHLCLDKYCARCKGGLADGEDQDIRVSAYEEKATLAPTEIPMGVAGSSILGNPISGVSSRPKGRQMSREHGRGTNYEDLGVGAMSWDNQECLLSGMKHLRVST
ncbi:hypothetical protein LTR37_020334 [Vermiconidia calcicola]|uniref:Uncharacterized protein n=1 Tax=Vermiconidia calcicola TaxID=1690605 RepID=A0ACC3MDG9_9PEZI|nr:hypothetical protein LTR37_020334 [Vermiconidia calcicola]